MRPSAIPLNKLSPGRVDHDGERSSTASTIYPVRRMAGLSRQTMDCQGPIGGGGGGWYIFSPAGRLWAVAAKSTCIPGYHPSPALANVLCCPNHLPRKRVPGGGSIAVHKRVGTVATEPPRGPGEMRESPQAGFIRACCPRRPHLEAVEPNCAPGTLIPPGLRGPAGACREAPCARALDFNDCSAAALSELRWLAEWDGEAGWVQIGVVGDPERKKECERYVGWPIGGLIFSLGVGCLDDAQPSSSPRPQANWDRLERREKLGRSSTKPSPSHPRAHFLRRNLQLTSFLVSANASTQDGGIPVKDIRYVPDLCDTPFGQPEGGAFVLRTRQSGACLSSDTPRTAWTRI